MKTHSLHNYSFIRNLRISLFVALFILITSTSFAQLCQYCPPLSSVNLNELTSKKYITFDKTITDTTTLKQVLNLPNAVIRGFGELSILNGLDNTPINQTTENYWAIIESVGIGDSTLTTNNLILSESPIYLDSNNEEVSISHLFYVKLNAQSDLLQLENLTQQNNVEILGNNKYMPLWYTLSCNKNSTGNALQMAILFQNSGLFATVQPDFMVKIETTCVNDPLFPSQWGLQNTGQNGGIAGLDINLCQAQQQLPKGKLYPNPSQHTVNYEITLATEQVGLLVFYDLMGKEIFANQLTTGDNKLTIDVSKFQNGLFLYKVFVNGKPQETGKFIIQH